MGKQAIGRIETTTYLIAAYGTFGVMGASLFGTAAGLASDRKFGWLEAKKATPMPVFAYFFAKVVMSMIFSAVVVLLLLFLGFAFGQVHLSAPVTFKLLATLVAGSLPFCAMGLAIGYFATPSSAPALINVFYIPMSFCSGLWVPIMFLPHFIQKMAVYLPPYHLARLAFGLIGLESGIPAGRHFQALIGLTMISLGVAWAGHQRDQRANG
jgi:ABC-2 type transport system permease protein